LTPVTQEELIDTLWQWTNLVETQPMADTTIDDPENYNIVFRADGTYSAKADCNVLNGSYELVGSQLTIQPGITTLAACAPDSKYDLYTSLLARVTGAGTREGTLVLLLDDGTAAMSYENAGESPVPTPAAAAASEPATVLGTPDGVENFDNTNNWTNFDTACFSTEITGGQFVMTANGQAQSACWEFSWPRLDNFYIETTLQMPESCDPQDRFGLIFRAPDNNRGYLYGFDCAGQYSLTIWDGQATTVLVPPTANAAIVNTPGGVNVMGLMAFEENISLYANGVYLETVSDYTYLDEGRIGYFVRAATDNPFTVRYDQLKVWVLEDELYPPDLAQPLPPIAIEPPSGDTASGEARVNVNVRTGPSMLFPILGTAPEGTTGQILGISPDGSWYAISVPTSRVGTGIAWSAADFVTLSNPTGQPLPVITPPLLPTTINFATPPQFAPQVVMREPATLRSGPTLEFPVFGVAPTGSRAEVVGESQDGEWWALRLPSNLASDNTGWVPKIFTVASNIPANLQVIPTPNLPRNINPAAPASGAPSLITREPLNVRSGPGNDYPSLGMVPLGTVMGVVGVSPDREHFVVNVPIDINATGTGWVAARFVRAENVSNVPVVQPPPVP
ncbi:MAG: META domain-containing protein, partial [Anaerolineales bacterium]